NNIEDKKSYQYALIICLFSIVFFYSTQLLRDIHVMFFYLLGMYLAFNKEFSLINFLKIFLVIIISCTLRIETGLFLFLLLPIYIISSLEKSNKKDYTIFFSIIISVLFIIFIIVNFNQIFNILSQNSEIYFESDKGDGVIGNLQKIPFLGSFL